MAKTTVFANSLGIALRAGEPMEQWINPEDWGAGFVLALLGKRHNRPELFQAALDRLDEKDEDHPREIADACLWDPAKAHTLAPWLVRLLDHPSPVARLFPELVETETALAAEEAFTLITGADIDKENLLRTLNEGNQRQRRLAVLYLKLHFGPPWRDCGWPLWLQGTDTPPSKQEPQEIATQTPDFGQ